MAAFDEGKSWIAIFVGVLITALGIIPLLNNLGVLSWNLPSVILNVIGGIAVWLIVVVAFVLFVETWWEHEGMKWISILVAIIFMAIGVIEILHSFSVITWHIPFLTNTVYYVLFVIEGLFLIIAAFAMD